MSEKRVWIWVRWPERERVIVVYLEFGGGFVGEEGGAVVGGLQPPSSTMEFGRREASSLAEQNEL